MVQGGLHRGVAVCKRPQVSLWPSPPQGLRSSPPPSPYTPCVLHTCIMGLGTKCGDQGSTMASSVPDRAKGSMGTME